MVVHNLGLALVLLTFFAFETYAQFYNRLHNERARIKESKIMARSERPNSTEYELTRRLAQKPYTGRCIREPTYLNIVIDLKKDGSFEIIKATQLSGEVILRDSPTSDFIYEATSDGTTLAVAFFPEDPFLVRGFGDPKNPNLKENSTQGTSAVLVINIPLIDESLSAINKIRLRILKLMPGTNISKIDSSVLEELKARKEVVLISDLPAKTFGRAIGRKLIRMRK